MEQIKSELKKFKKNDFWPGQQWKEAAKIFFLWAVPAIAFILITKYFESFRTVEYYNEAISQGIGGNFWNVMCVIGATFFGLSLVFIKIKSFSYIANQILRNAYAIGALTFGLLFGQFLCLLPEVGQYLSDWRFYLFGAFSAVLFIVFAILNLFAWYLSYLVQWQGKFHLRINQLHYLIHIIPGWMIVCLSIWLLWIEQ